MQHRPSPFGSKEEEKKDNNDLELVYQFITESKEMNSVRWLESRGIGINGAFDATGETPLMVAARYGAIRALQDLLNEPNLRTLNADQGIGHTALMLAAQNGHLEAVRALYNAGAETDFSCQGKSALSLATAGRHEDVVQFLLRHGANRVSRRNNGDTPEHVERFERPIPPYMIPQPFHFSHVWRPGGVVPASALSSHFPRTQHIISRGSSLLSQHNQYCLLGIFLQSLKHGWMKRGFQKIIDVQFRWHLYETL